MLRYENGNSFIVGEVGEYRRARYGNETRLTKPKAPKLSIFFWRSELLDPRQRQALKYDKDASAASICIAFQE
jgi:hypothetical protein